MASAAPARNSPACYRPILPSNPSTTQARGFIYAGNATVQLSEKHKLFGLVQYDSRTQGGNTETYAGNYATNQYGGGTYALRLSSTWTTRLTSRFLVSYNNKGSNDSLEAIGGVGKLPSLNVYLATNLSAGKLVGNTNLATLNNLGSRNVSPAHKPTISGDVTYYVGKAAGSHEIQTGFYLQPKAATKSTTYYANGGFNSEDDVLRDPGNPGAGLIPFHRHYVDANGGLVTSYIGANDYAWYLQDRWRPFARLTITAGLRADWRQRPPRSDRYQPDLQRQSLGRTSWTPLRTMSISSPTISGTGLSIRASNLPQPGSPPGSELISTYTLAYDHIAGTWQPGDPASFIQPETFANDAGIGTVRGNTTNSYTADTRNRSRQHHQWRTGLTWAAPWNFASPTHSPCSPAFPPGPSPPTCPLPIRNMDPPPC